MKKKNIYWETSAEMIEDEIRQCRAAVAWVNSGKRKAFLEKYDRDLAAERKKWDQNLRKEKWLRLSAPFRAIGKFFSSMLELS